MFRQVVISNRQTVGNDFVFVQIEQIDDSASFCVSSRLRQVVDLLPVAFSEVRKEHQIGVRRRDEQVLNRVFVFDLGAFDAFAAAALSFVFVCRRALDVPVGGNRNDHGFFLDEVFQVDVADVLTGDFRAALVAKLALDVERIAADNRQNVGVVGKNRQVRMNVRHEAAEFLNELFLFQVDQLPQGHVENGVRLNRGERVFVFNAVIFGVFLEPVFAQGAFNQRARTLNFRHQARFGFLLSGAGADDLDNLVDIGVSEHKPFDDVFARPRFFQQEDRSAANNVHAVPQELFQNFLERQRSRLAVYQSDKVNRERALQRRVFVKLIENDIRVGVSLEFQNQTNRLLEVRLVADIADALDFALIDHVGNALFDVVARGLIGNVGNDDSMAVVFHLLNFCCGANEDCASPGVVSFSDSAASANNAAGGEVRSRTQFQQFVNRNAGIVNELDKAVADFAQIVRRNAGCHADGDAVCAVDQQVGELGRQYRRFHSATVVRGHEVDRAEVDVFQHQLGEAGHARFCVSHSGRRKPGDRAEVPLFVYQNVAHHPFLSHTNQRWVNDGFAVGVIVARRIARDFSAFDSAGAGGQIEVVHRNQNTALRGL